MKLQILQSSKVVKTLKRKSKGIGPEINSTDRQQADEYAKEAVNNGMESGYYDLYLLDKNGKVVDTEILIA